MEIKAYVCPQCGASLEVRPDASSAFCPHCGSRLHISYEGETPPVDPDRRQFIASDTGVSLATAVVPDGFELSGALSSQWQSDYVPYTAVIHAVNNETGVTMLSASREMFTDYRSPVLKGMIKLSTTAIRSSLRAFVEPEEYLTGWASQMTGMTLTPVASATLPTPFAEHPEAEASLLHGQFQQTASLDAMMGYQLVNLACEPLMVKYEAHTQQGSFLVLCGGEICGYEVGTAMFHVPEGVASTVGKAFSGVRDALSGATARDENPAGGAGVAGMTFDDWMRGGLVGKMMRDRKARQQAYPGMGQQQRQADPPATEAQRPQNKELPPDGRIPLGHADEYGRHSDIVVWGSARRYLLVAPAEQGEAATELFLRFAASVMPDQALEQQAQQQVAQRVNQVAQQNAQMQAQAQQMQMQTRQMQMQTSQMIARNSQQVSAGIMDSWDRRQAAQSRMSASYSEAVRGVNSYTTPTGGTVEMGVVADHVYQDAHGDVIGVSGGAVDSELASKLNWTELERQ